MPAINIENGRERETFRYFHVVIQTGTILYPHMPLNSTIFIRPFISKVELLVERYWE